MIVDIPLTRRRSAKLTPLMAEDILRLHHEVKMLQQDIASLLQVNQGRVSEVVNGHKYPELATRYTQKT